MTRCKTAVKMRQDEYIERQKNQVYSRLSEVSKSDAEDQDSDASRDLVRVQKGIRVWEDFV